MKKPAKWSLAHIERGIVRSTGCGWRRFEFVAWVQVKFCWSATGHEAPPQAQDAAAQCAWVSAAS